jgi:hypothetical protein
VVPVAPMKSTLKAPGSKRLKLEHRKLLSKFALNSRLRRFTEEALLVPPPVPNLLLEARAYPRPLFSSM